MQLKDLVFRENRDEKSKEIVLAYEKDLGDRDFTLQQCPNCGTTIDTDYYQLCAVCIKLGKGGTIE